MSGINIPAIPASVDPAVRQAIAELKNRILELQRPVAATTTQSASRAQASGVTDTPLDERTYVRSSGGWVAIEILEANSPITPATKTKITYDARGLVTAGANATTADIADSSNKRYVTDANLVVVGNTSNTNTGDQDLSGLAPASKGVTNGDTHDHSGGDGAQIDHGSLAGLTDYDHPQYVRGASPDGLTVLTVADTGIASEGDLSLFSPNGLNSFQLNDLSWGVLLTDGILGNVQFYANAAGGFGVTSYGDGIIFQTDFYVITLVGSSSITVDAAAGVSMSDETGANTITLTAAGIGTNSKITTYNNIATEDYGIPAIVDGVHLAAQVADITATNITNANAAGNYEVEYYLQATTADVLAGTVMVTFGYTDDVGATTVSSSALPLTATGRASGRLYVRMASGNLTYSTTHTGIFGTGQYRVDISTKRVN